MLNPLEELCTYDPRNPYHTRFDDEESPKPRERDCACDACFYGRDDLALEIIRLREALKKVLFVLQEGDTDPLQRIYNAKENIRDAIE